MELELPNAPLHVLEEAGIDALTSADVPDVLFSAVTARGISAIGSTFMPEQPDPRGARAARSSSTPGSFLPGARARSAACAPARARRSADGRPMLGRLDEHTYVASGHGAWGITLGPASARLVADQILGRPAEIPPALSATRSALSVTSCRSSSCRWSSTCRVVVVVSVVGRRAGVGRGVGRLRRPMI